MIDKVIGIHKMDIFTDGVLSTYVSRGCRSRIFMKSNDFYTFILICRFINNYG